MRTRLYLVFLLLAVCLLSVGGVFLYNQRSTGAAVGGYVFPKATKDIEKIVHISVEQGGQTINLDLKDNLWRVREANGYYANYMLMRSLFTDVYNSQYTTLIKGEKDVFDAPVDVMFFGADEKVIDEIVLGKKDDKQLYTFAKRGGDRFMISGRFILPADIPSWLQNPTFMVEADEIMSFETKRDSGEWVTADFSNAPDVLKGYLGFIYFANAREEKAVDAVDLEKFTRMGRLPVPNVDLISPPVGFAVTTYDGLRMEFMVFPDGNKYWGRIKLGTNKLPTVETSNYVKDNAFLYEGWEFELPQDFGQGVYRWLMM